MARRMFSVAIVAVSTVVALFAAGIAHSAEISPELKKIIEAAKKEGSVNLVVSPGVLGGGDAAVRAEKEMNALYGTSIKVKFSPGPEVPVVSSQIMADLKAGRPARTDILAGTNSHIPPLSKMNALKSVDWKALLPGRITDDIIEVDGQAIRVYTTLPGGIVYNKSMISSVPVALTDLLKPEWKNKIASTPYAGSFDLLGGTWGVDQTYDFAKKLSGQLAGLIRCPELERVASGEFIALAPDCSGRAWAKLQEQGAPLDYVIPSDFPALRYYYMAIPTNAEHPNAALLYAAFLMTEQGQKIMWDTQNNDLDSLAGSRMTPIIDGYKKKGYKFVEYTIGWLNDHPEMSKVQEGVAKIFSQR